MPRAIAALRRQDPKLVVRVPLPALAFITLVHHGQLPTMLAAFRAALMEAGEMSAPIKRARGRLSRPAS